MEFTFIRTVVLGATSATIIGIGLLTGVVSILMWLVFASIAVVPAVLALTLCTWTPTLSTSLQEVRR
jgi:hypothetical protein